MNCGRINRDSKDKLLSSPSDQLVISVPAKTFIVGEYAALNGGHSLILTTAPTFKLIIKLNPQKLETFYTGIHPDSPGGRLMQYEKDFFQDYLFEFIDPYEGKGGLGASTAQFVMLLAFKLKFNIVTFEDITGMLAVYRELSWNKQGLPPSGADMVAQLIGGISFFSPQQKRVMMLNWQFPDLTFFLLHTNNKIATHEHLQGLTSLNTKELEKIVTRTLNSLTNHHTQEFLMSINHYALVLSKMGLVHPHTEALLEKVKKQHVLAAKGCGALGADIILVVCEKNKSKVFERWVIKENLVMMAMGNKAAKGLEINHAAQHEYESVSSSQKKK